MYKFTLKPLSILLFTLTGLCSYSQTYKNPKAGVEARISDLLGRMTLEEKIDQLSGTGDIGFDTHENTRLGIPTFKMSDGPLGVRWGSTTSFPSGAAVAATWDTALVAKFAAALAEETHARGRNMLLGPCVNIHRLPIGGRNFESYGEDPWLTSRLAVSYIRSLQAHGVIASVKHFALNNQEWKRTEVNVTADERTMREIYLPSFEAAVKEAGVYTVMSAYNKVNGSWCSENKDLLTDILKNEWNFRGLVVSDWVSTHSTVKAANSGLDLEMPEGNVFSMINLKKAIASGEVSEATINDKVSRILRVKFNAGLFDKTTKADTAVLTGEDHKKLARRIAEEGIVLLKNEKNLLPLNPEKIRKIAVIGPNAAIARVGGGGSSLVNPHYSVSPLEGIRNIAGKSVEIVFAQGDILQDTPLQPIDKQYLRTPDQKNQGLACEFFDGKELAAPAKYTGIDTTVYFNWDDNPPVPGIGKDNYSVRWSGMITAPVSRKYTFYTASDDGVRLYIDDKLLIDNWTDHGTTVDSAKIEMIAGKAHKIRLQFYENGGNAVMMLGWDLPVKKTGPDLIAEAVKTARNADMAIVFAGTSDSFESEGFDRTGGMRLPGSQDELIRAVADANPNTVVVLNTGTPVITGKWLDKVPALLETFFAGQEGGSAIAEILFGKQNPSGKLPFSFIGSEEQSPAFKHYKEAGLEAPYQEGIFTGYRYLEKNKMTPTFPFGFGLSYTSFIYTDLIIEDLGNRNFKVTMNVKNSGSKAGGEIVQLYVAEEHPVTARPVKELKGFSRIFLNPGETGKVTMYLNSRSFAWYDVAGKQWRVTPGGFLVSAGSSSVDIRLKNKLIIN